MNKIPRCKTKRLNEVKQIKRVNIIPRREDIKSKIFEGKCIKREFGTNLINSATIKERKKVQKKSNNYKGSVSLK